MNTFFRQQLRGLLVTLLTGALLIGAVGFSVIGYAAGEGSRQQVEAIDSRYLTVGVLREQPFQPFIYSGIGPNFDWNENMNFHSDMMKLYVQNHTRLEDGSIQWEDGTVFYSSSRLEEKAVGAPQIISVNHSGILSAHVEGIYGLTSGSQDKSQFNLAFDNNSYNFCVVVGTVYKPSISYAMETRYNWTATIDGELTRYYSYCRDMTLSTPVSAHPYYARIINRYYPRVSMNKGERAWVTMQTETGAPLFRYGAKYIVRGFYYDRPMIMGNLTYRDENWNTKQVYGYVQQGRDDDQVAWPIEEMASRYPRGLDEDRFAFTTNDINRFPTLAKGVGSGPENFRLALGSEDTLIPTYFLNFPDEGLPYYAEITGTLEEFLASEEGEVWRDVIIPMAEINQQSATVILTDNVDYLAGFSSGEAVTVTGREIEPAEYADGSRVCMVSTAYAEQAGLSVGDRISLDFYDTGYFLSGAEIELPGRRVYDINMTHYPLQEANRIGVKQEYEIVGIYAAPEWEFGSQTFHADTIFVPKASVPNAEEYEDRSLPLLNSITILNGSGDQFEAYMEEQGFDNYYDFYDHDYSSNIAGFQAMELNARRLLLIGMVVLVITAILFYYLNFRRMVPVALTMRRLGQGRLCVWWQMVSATVPLVLLAVLGGALAGVFGFDLVIDAILHAEMYLDVQAVVYMALAEAAVLTVPVLLISIPLSMPNMMKKE